VATPLLDVRHLTVSYLSPSGPIHAVRDLSLNVAPGEIVALAGETGCGKSTLALSLLGLLDRRVKLESGSILFEGRELTSLTEKQWRAIRGRRIGMVFQDARGALNPVLTIGDHVLETLRAHQALPRRQARAAVVRLLAEVGIPEPDKSAHSFPHELSGGMCQRVGIALAICNQPLLLIADEPTSALDPTLQGQILSLLQEMRQRQNLALLLISHDLALVSDVADRVAVMYLGRLVECGPAALVLSRPSHPYTRGLLRSQPSLDHHRERKPLEPIPGSPPPPGSTLQGCPFAPRCPVAEPVCAEAFPAPVEVAPGHYAACVKAGADI
jgi:oligopeptide/dipeptide ABC transporter ATP-binding protein